MYRKIIIPLYIIVLFSCKSKSHTDSYRDKRINLRSDTVNIVRITDTLQIWQSVCRGCAYENSTRFDISDSLGLVKLDGVETVDNNPPDMDGGSLGKYIVIAPLKTGSTVIKMYRFENAGKNIEADSSSFTLYSITVLK